MPSRSTTTPFTDCSHVGIGHADHRRVGDGRVLLEAALDLGRVDVLGGRLDHARRGPDERQRPVGLAPSEVVRVVPAVAEAVRGLVGPVPVAVHHERSARADLADLAGRELVVVGVDDARSA